MFKSVRKWRRQVLNDRKQLGGKLVIVSFPKSGRTWLRVMLDALSIPAEYTHDGADHRSARHHRELNSDKKLYKDCKIVFLSRDPRDVVVSGYFQALNRIGNYKGTLSEFIKDEHHGIEKVVIFNERWRKYAGHVRAFMEVEYEELHAAPVEVLTRIANFAGVRRPEKKLMEHVTEECKFENMQKKEREGGFVSSYGRILQPTDETNIDSYKVRRGKIGGYVDYMTPEDIEYCELIMKKYKTNEPMG